MNTFLFDKINYFYKLAKLLEEYEEIEPFVFEDKSDQSNISKNEISEIEKEEFKKIGELLDYWRLYGSYNKYDSHSAITMELMSYNYLYDQDYILNFKVNKDDFKLVIKILSDTKQDLNIEYLNEISNKDKIISKKDKELILIKKHDLELQLNSLNYLIEKLKNHLNSYPETFDN